MSAEQRLTDELKKQTELLKQIRVNSGIITAVAICGLLAVIAAFAWFAFA